VAGGIFLGLLHLYGSGYPEKPHRICCFFWARLVTAELWVRPAAFQHVVLCTPSVRGGRQSVLHEILNHKVNLSLYPSKLERPTFPKPVAISLVIYSFYLCFHTSPDSCLLSCLEKWSPGWLQRLWTTRNY